jgi:DNA (cytosine-5)-methyltransferase 1
MNPDLKPTIGSLFAGIGGFDLAFQREGYEIAWQVENNDYCNKVLAKHWPHVSRFGDVRDCGLHNLEPVDVITGGFPCQDLSVAGKQEGLDGERSALWWDYHRIISELRPRFAVVENVPNLYNRGIDRVCGSLAEVGYDAEWHVISAADMGAPHLRKRVWLCTWPNAVGDPSGSGLHWQSWRGAGAQSEDRHTRLEKEDEHYWTSYPSILRVAHGVPHRVDRIKGLGNAIVPQIAQQIARTLKPHFSRDRAFA